MDKIIPSQAVAQVSGGQPTNSITHSGEVRKSISNGGTLGGPSLGVAQNKSRQSSGHQKLGPSQQAGNKLIPADQRLSTLEDVFDDKTLKQVGVVECVTCSTRTYQDQSDDAGVSFQTPTHLSPGQAASAVISHEMEHVAHEQADAQAEGKEVIAQSVQIFQSICPECGKGYVSGGVTKTTTASRSNPYKDAMTNQTAGNLVDMIL